jgi:hypothetical protein
VAGSEPTDLESRVNCSTTELSQQAVTKKTFQARNLRIL